MSTKQLSKWGEMYRGRIGDSYPAYCREQYQPFLNVIRTHMRGMRYAAVREEGCGIATITKILAQDANPSRFSFSAFDLNQDQAASAISNLQSLKASVHVRVADIMEPQGHVDIIHSHGVLEHFGDVEITHILERQRKEAKVVVHYVPLIGWQHKSFGDERLLHIDHWREIHAPNAWLTFNDGKDAVLIWHK